MAFFDCRSSYANYAKASSNRMETWVRISLLLCIFGFLKEFRPSEPFITQYFLNPPLNFTNEQVSQSIYPISTYSHMIQLIIVFLVTDYLRYKPVIVVDALSGITVYIMLIVCRSLFAMQVLEVFYGTFMAGEVAYYTYIYAKVDKEHFQEVSSHTRSAYLAGRCVSGIVSQSLIYFGFSYYYLQFFTLGGLILAALWALLLPPVERSVYFHRHNAQPALENPAYCDITDGKKESSDCSSEPDTPSDSSISESSGCHQALQFLWHDFVSAFTNLYVIKWAFWWALATCGYYQVLSYVQILWDVIQKDTNNTDQLWNGAVETAYTLFGAAATMAMGKIKLNWRQVGESVLALCSICCGLVLYLMAQTNSLILAYVTYVIFTVIFHMMITVANSEVAKHLNDDSYGLIFGITTFIALSLQSVLTYTVVSKQGLRLSARPQFYVYSGYFTILGVIFVFVVLFRCIHSLTTKSTRQYSL